MKNNLSFLIVDDDIDILDSLKQTLSISFPNYKIITANNGEEALNIIQDAPIDMILSDINMPIMDGFSLCKKIRETDFLKDIYFIMFTGSSEHDLVSAFECGADDFISKPFTSTSLKARIKSATRIINLQLELKKENKLLSKLSSQLEADFLGMKRLAVNFLKARIPSITSMLTKIENASIWISKELGDVNEKQQGDIKLASSLCYAGKIFLPDDQVLTPVMRNGIPSNEFMCQVPVYAKDILSSVEQLENASILLYHLYENFDGTGLPDKLRSWQIPIGSRIIRVVLDFYEKIFLNSICSSNSYDIMINAANRLYDHKLVVLLEQYIAITGEQNQEINEIAVKIFELEPGMEISRNIISIAGFTLFTEGTVLNENSIERLITHNTTDHIIGNVIVKVE